MPIKDFIPSMRTRYLVALFLFLNFIGFGQCLVDNFDSGYGNWSDGSGTYQNATAGVSGNGTGFNTTGDDIITATTVTNPQTLTIWLASSSTTSNKTLSIQYSTSNTGPWTTALDILNSQVTTTHQQFSANLSLTGDYYLRIAMTQRTGGSYYLDDVEVVCGAAGPTITATPASLTGFTYQEGSGPSTEQSFDVSGSNLTNDITVTPPANWEVSTTSGGPYQTTAITLSQTGGNVASTTIYTRMVSGLLNTNSPFSGNMVCASTGATSQNVAVDGTVTLPSGTSCSELFISEYVEGSSNNKYIEIFNPTGGTITLAGVYDIVIYFNGSATPSSTIALTGSIPSQSVYVLANSSATEFTGTVDQSSGSLTFNGDDAVTLVKNGSLIDVIGQIGFDPGSEWAGATCTEGTAEGTLVRNFAVDVGDSNGSDAFDPDTEWTCYPQDTVSNLGTHSSICSACTPTHTISGFSPSSGAVGATATISGTGFTASSTVQFNGTSATVTFVNSTTLTATVPSGATTGVITVTEAGCDVDSVSDFTVTACTPTHTITGFAPTSGPEGTEVTITGTGFTGSSTIEFGGVSATIISQTATQIVAEVPIGASSGAIRVIEAGCPLDSSSGFTVFDTSSCSLSGGVPAGFTDLMFTGIYDETSGSCHYIELFNPTASAIDLSAYSIGSSNNQADATTLPGTYNGGTYPLSGIIQPYSTFLILATSDSSNCASCNNVTLDLQFLSSALGYNGYTSANYDKLVLLNGATPIDLWSNGDGHDDGYIYTRLTSATAPTTTFNSADWSSNTTPDCFGFAISSTIPPTVDSHPTDVTSCSASTFSIVASAGNGGALTYQWKYNDGSAAGWSDVTSAAFASGTVTGETSNTLSITGFNLDGYQFYCAVTEDSACTVASNPAQYNVSTISWDGSAWSTGSPPTINDNAVINGNYDTAVNGSFSACQLFVNAELRVGNSTFVEIENDVVVIGEIRVETQGAFVQNNDSGQFVLDVGANAMVNKITALKQEWYYYTYWSSPVEAETVSGAFPDTPANRRYFFDSTQYLDANSDDIDDDGNDWQIAPGTSIMTPGVGYAATSSPLGLYPGTDSADFEGAFNNGIITVPIYYNTTNLTSWNFIGNPYASAIDFDLFYSENSGVLGGAAYFWSQSLPPDDSNPGNEQANFSQNDYAIYTVGSGGTASANGNIPDRYIPSAQGFFVEGLGNGNVVFNNSMRSTGNNNNFYRLSSNNGDINRIWIDLTSNNGVFNQVLMAYVDGATNAYDGMIYDAPRNLSTGQAAILYTNIPENSRKYAIQGKAPESLDVDEVIYLGFKNTIEVDTQFTLSLAQLEGDFMNSHTVYLIDNLLGHTHDLSQSDYAFTSEVGEFNERFEIRFSTTTLSDDNIIFNNDALLVFDNPEKGWDISTSQQSVITQVVLYDLMGRELFNSRFNNQTTITINNSKYMSSSIYVVKVLTNDNRVFTRKVVKD